MNSHKVEFIESHAFYSAAAQQCGADRSLASFLYELRWSFSGFGPSPPEISEKDPTQSLHSSVLSLYFSSGIGRECSGIVLGLTLEPGSLFNLFKGGINVWIHFSMLVYSFHCFAIHFHSHPLSKRYPTQRSKICN